MKSKEERYKLVWGGMSGNGPGVELGNHAKRTVADLLMGDLPENVEDFDDYMKKGLEDLFEKVANLTLYDTYSPYQHFKNEVYGTNTSEEE